MMTATWFSQYMHQVSANVVNREGEIRFTYKQLRQSLDAITSGNEEQVPRDVLKLFSNIIGVLPTIELNDNTERLLFLALLNCHMAYHLVSGHLLNKDESFCSM